MINVNARDKFLAFVPQFSTRSFITPVACGMAKLREVRADKNAVKGKPK
jgi:hypothetical protein